MLFGDGVYYRVVLELRVDSSQTMRERQRGGHQLVFPASAVNVHAVWVLPNASPGVGEERLSSWNPAHEALPAGCRAPEVLCNPRDLLANPWPRDTVAAPDARRYPPPSLPWMAYVNAGHGTRQLRCLMCLKNVWDQHQEFHGEGGQSHG